MNQLTQLRQAAWKDRGRQDLCSLHELAPYIGRMNPHLASELIEALTLPNDHLVDPFCGSGAVVLEGALRGRKVTASDINPYAVTLTKAKLFPPPTLDEALKELEGHWPDASHNSHRPDQSTPKWVAEFFHPDTLTQILSLRDKLVEAEAHFLLACLLGILHHQRPGFLSYPASHLIPYLRDKKFPRSRFPELYEFRDVKPRMVKKVERSFRRFKKPLNPTRHVYEKDLRALSICDPIDCIITSPPYMNKLDYIRDNRLRLWFVNRQLPVKASDNQPNHRDYFVKLMEALRSRLVPLLCNGGHLALVLGEVSRGRKRNSVSTSAIAESILTEQDSGLTLVHQQKDAAPDVRKSRSKSPTGRKETILIFRKEAEGS